MLVAAALLALGACIPLYGDCTHDQLNCCFHSKTTSCYRKNEWYSQCLDSCDPKGKQTIGWNCSHPPPGPEPKSFECHHYVTGNPICLPGIGPNATSLKTCDADCKPIKPPPGPVPGMCDPKHGGKPASKATACACLDPAGSGVALPCARSGSGQCRIPNHDEWGLCEAECCETA